MDVIYRQVAIDAVQGIDRLATLPDNDAVVRMSAVEYVLFNLPIAQSEIIRCKVWLIQYCARFDSLPGATPHSLMEAGLIMKNSPLVREGSGSIPDEVVGNKARARDVIAPWE